MANFKTDRANLHPGAKIRLFSTLFEDTNYSMSLPKVSQIVVSAFNPADTAVSGFNFTAGSVSAVVTTATASPSTGSQFLIEMDLPSGAASVGTWKDLWQYTFEGSTVAISAHQTFTVTAPTATITTYLDQAPLDVVLGYRLQDDSVVHGESRPFQVKVYDQLRSEIDLPDSGTLSFHNYNTRAQVASASLTKTGKHLYNGRVTFDTAAGFTANRNYFARMTLTYPAVSGTNSTSFTYKSPYMEMQVTN